jgi:hypothetical protein
MRRPKWPAAVLILLALASLSCGRQKKAGGGDSGQLLSVVNAADPRAAGQLTRGFHVIEGNAWRWAAKDFEVTLRRPEGAAQNGARLEMKFAVPEHHQPSGSDLAKRQPQWPRARAGHLLESRQLCLYSRRPRDRARRGSRDGRVHDGQGAAPDRPGSARTGGHRCKHRPVAPMIPT